MTDEELASQPGGVATRSDEEAEGAVAEHVFSPKDFRLNLETKLLVVPDAEPLPNLDSPSIRKLTWEHVVPDRPESSSPNAATTSLPPPRRIPPPPPVPTSSFQPPPPAPVAQPNGAVAEADIVPADVEDEPIADVDAVVDVDELSTSSTRSR